MAPRIKIAGRLIGAHCSIAGGVANAVLVGNRIGCTAIQLFTTSNRQWEQNRLTADDVDEFRKNMRKGSVRFAFSHAMYLINLAAPKPAIFRKSIDAMTGEIERAGALGLPFVVVHPGSPKEKGREWGIFRVAEAVSRVLEKTADLKTGIALETTAGQGHQLGRTFEELAAIMDIVKAGDRLSICFDTCHAFSAGYDIRSPDGYKKTWDEFDKIIGLKKLSAIHLNDSKGGLGSHIDRHEHIGKGKIGLRGFANIMNDPRIYNIPMVIETPKEDDAFAKDGGNLRRLMELIRKK
jgi:deoxyribonuclease-4